MPGWGRQGADSRRCPPLAGAPPGSFHAACHPPPPLQLLSRSPALPSLPCRGFCTHRQFTGENVTDFKDHNFYQLEMGLHEMLLQSPHRTLDPEVGALPCRSLGAGRACMGGARRARRGWPSVPPRQCFDLGMPARWPQGPVQRPRL